MSCENFLSESFNIYIYISHPSSHRGTKNVNYHKSITSLVRNSQGCKFLAGNKDIDQSIVINIKPIYTQIEGKEKITLNERKENKYLSHA